MVFFSTRHRNEKCEKQKVSPPSYVSVSTFPGGLATSRALAGWGTETDRVHSLALALEPSPGWSAVIPLIKLPGWKSWSCS